MTECTKIAIYSQIEKCSSLKCTYIDSSDQTRQDNQWQHFSDNISMLTIILQSFACRNIIVSHAIFRICMISEVYNIIFYLTS